MRGSFPLNGTYFQVNEASLIQTNLLEVFADHDSSYNPIDVPRQWIWNLPRRTAYFGASVYQQWEFNTAFGKAQVQK
ncbi:transcriptional activator DEMETER [Prunus yedoensis var. nudiflora]|uniref:Transcriptional activator DEMETER n=1 Tax=Prunus yedoensis var. nudiflora TaxID=2094558 RepID=A0A314Y0F1_PRUYE|nr:transcriptional activator DEMETER [Prunus yedoensis var. nudiflora]